MTTVAQRLPKIPNYVNGHWTEPQVHDWLEVKDPATGNPIGKVPLSNASEVARAVEAAAAAYPEWRRTPPEDRIQPLFKLKQLLEDHVDEVARILTQANGKTAAEAKAELRRAI